MPAPPPRATWIEKQLEFRGILSRTHRPSTQSQDLRRIIIIRSIHRPKQLRGSLRSSCGNDKLFQLESKIQPVDIDVQIKPIVAHSAPVGLSRLTLFNIVESTTEIWHAYLAQVPSVCVSLRGPSGLLVFCFGFIGFCRINRV